MKKFAILRQIPPGVTREQVDVAALQNIFNLSAIGAPAAEAFDPRLSSDCELAWVRSYWHEGSDWGMCLYTSRSEADLELYHVACDVAYARFDHVRELRSPAMTRPGDGQTRQLDGRVLCAFEMDTSRAVSLTSAEFESMAAFGDAGPTEDFGASAAWVRAYVDEARGRFVATYAVPPAMLGRLASHFTGTGVTLHPITEVMPEEYGAEAPITWPED